ncbi:MAG: sigma-54 dependent transcriptional regulator [candidate division KSB1 bacterium]|nr:sigma-54 dependent transcriptional regulator [candidate division KSB1 bacterium]MDZ7342088.1 sigma-54 dependent transcriptional regulator [candidate division KSB1 bacterium]
MARILIVEDDLNTLSGLVEIIRDEGYDVVGVESGRKALKILERESFDLMLTDLRMPDIDGFQLYEKSQAFNRDMKTIVMTAYSSVKDAVEAMKKGVYEYLTKPLDLDELFLTIKKVVQEKQLLDENIQLRDQIKRSYRFENIIGNSKAIREIYKIITKVAKTQSTVLIRGESGVGKELVARAIHYNSLRANKTLVEISCATLPETLLESELFGYEKGAFTGAITRKKGRLELADGGTIFLDEIGDISESVQTKLLRVLQEKEITHLGSTTSIKVDVRVITATNRNLEQALREGKFREDLYYRLNVIPIFIPPLRERKEDIPLLIEYFVKKFCQANNKPLMKFSDKALDLCLNYDWPGNVRELENAVENAVVLGEGDTIEPQFLPMSIYAPPNHSVNLRFLDEYKNESYRKKMDFAERMIIRDAIDKAGGNKSIAAKNLKISLRTMRYKIKKYNL